MEPLGKDRAKKLAKLHSTKGRRQAGMTLLDSLPLIEEGLRHGLVDELFVLDGRESDCIKQAERAEITITSCSDEHFDKLCDVKSSPGFVALTRLPEVKSLVTDDIELEKRKFVVYLDRINNPGNLGTMVRSVAAFGCDLLIVSPDCADPFSPKSLRASAGALLRLDVAEGFLEPRDDWPMFYRAVSRDGVDPANLKPAAARGLWLGNEAQGPRDPKAGLKVTDVTIPMDAHSESLNVMAAASILAYILRS